MRNLLKVFEHPAVVGISIGLLLSVLVVLTFWGLAWLIHILPMPAR